MEGDDNLEFLQTIAAAMLENNDFAVCVLNYVSDWEYYIEEEGSSISRRGVGKVDCDIDEFIALVKDVPIPVRLFVNGRIAKYMAKALFAIRSIWYLWLGRVQRFVIDLSKTNISKIDCCKLPHKLVLPSSGKAELLISSHVGFGRKFVKKLGCIQGQVKMFTASVGTGRHVSDLLPKLPKAECIALEIAWVWDVTKAEIENLKLSGCRRLILKPTTANAGIFCFGTTVPALVEAGFEVMYVISTKVMMEIRDRNVGGFREWAPNKVHVLILAGYEFDHWLLIENQIAAMKPASLLICPEAHAYVHWWVNADTLRYINNVCAGKTYISIPADDNVFGEMNGFKRIDASMLIDMFNIEFRGLFQRRHVAWPVWQS